MFFLDQIYFSPFPFMLPFMLLYANAVACHKVVLSMAEARFDKKGWGESKSLCVCVRE